MEGAVLWSHPGRCRVLTLEPAPAFQKCPSSFPRTPRVGKTDSGSGYLQRASGCGALLGAGPGGDEPTKTLRVLGRRREARERSDGSCHVCHVWGRRRWKLERISQGDDRSCRKPPAGRGGGAARAGRAFPPVSQCKPGRPPSRGPATGELGSRGGWEQLSAAWAPSPVLQPINQ